MITTLASLPGLGRAVARLGTVESHRLAMPDGIVLATDVHRPAGPGRWPVVLIRTSYGRTGLTGIPMVLQARVLAGLGYAVVLQDVRGRGDSGGSFVPAVNEAEDGGRTIDWIADQPWSDGTLGCWGTSYLGATAWAATASRPGAVDALAVGITHSALGLPDPRGVRHLETTIRWLRSLDVMAQQGTSIASRLRDLVEARRRAPDMLSRMQHLPVDELDEVVLGSPSDIWQTWAEHPSATDSFWRAGDHSSAVPGAPPTAHTTGWWDVFADGQLDDHARAPVPTPLLVGPWTHLDPRVQVASLQQARRHFDAHLRGGDLPDPSARVWLSGADRWWTLPQWPPSTTTCELLLAGRSLVEGDAATADDPVALTYDPADPTPSVGGRSLSIDAGRADCAALESRDDVHVLTGPPLSRPRTLAGTARLSGVVTADVDRTDLAVRITDVDRSGRSVSVADGFARVTEGASEGVQIEVDLHPVAHRFAPGHRIRLLLAGGAFPHFDRNLGEPPGLDGPVRLVLDRASLFLPVLR